MKIGDKVSFLGETGGGVIAGFQGKNIVLVEDEDGFQIPTPINEVVVIGNDDYSIAKVVAKTESKPKDNKSVKALLADGTDSDVDTDVEDVDIADKEVTFKMPAEERKGGNMLSCYLAFVPINIKEMTTTRFEAYLVNDCNYCLQYSFMTAEGNAWTLHSQGEIEPNTSLYIEEVGREELNSLSSLNLSLRFNLGLTPSSSINSTRSRRPFISTHRHCCTPLLRTTRLRILSISMQLN